MKQIDKGKLAVIFGTVLILIVMSNLLFAPTPYLRVFNVLVESLNALFLAYLYLAVSKLKDRSYYLYLATGFYLSFIALSTDTLDQFYLHSELYTAIFEKGFKLAGYMFVFIGVRLWFKDYKKLTKQLSHQVITDNLTQIYNRRGITNQLEKIQQSSEIKAAIILADFDDFKQINDQYGHHIGDIVLQKISGYFLSIKSEQHIPGRWGGEEFVIVAKGYHAKDAVELCVSIKSLLEKMDLSEYIGDAAVTLSYGVSEMQANEHYEECIKRADQALYQSKRNGKNCINVR